MVRKSPKIPAKNPVSGEIRADCQWNRIIFGLILFWSFLLGCTYMRSTDVWWHLKTGAEILQRGELPQTDWFTMTSVDRSWIDLHWGFQLMIHLVYQLADVSGLILLKAICLTLTLAIGWHAVESEFPASWRVLFWIPAMICLSGRAVVRPEMLTLVFLALELWILFKANDRISLLWWIPVVQLVWLNCHALFILGLIVTVAWAMDQQVRIWYLHRRKTGEEPEVPDTKKIWLPVLAALLVSFLNPWFVQGAIFPFELYKKFSTDQVLYSGIAEFQPPWLFVMRSGLGNLYLLSQLFLWLLTAGTFGLLLFQKKASLFRWILFLAMTHLAWKASRNTSISAVVFAVIACQNLSQYFSLMDTTKEERRKSSKKKKETDSGKFVSKPDLVVAILLVVLSGSIFTGLWARLGGEGKYLSLSEQPEWYIHGPAKFAGQDGMPEEAFVANMGQASVYLFHNGPERKVFMDGRLEVASPETYRAYMAILELMKNGNPGWIQVFNEFRSVPEQSESDSEAGKEWQFPAVVLDSRYSRFQMNTMLQMPDWKLVYADGSGAVFVHQTIAEKLNLPEADPKPLLRPLSITQ